MRANEVGHLLAGEGVNPDKIQAPPFVAATEGKAYIFQGGDDDNGDDNPDAISVPAKVEINGSSRAKMFSEKVMKARKAYVAKIEVYVALFPFPIVLMHVVFFPFWYF
ncbi:hypothetical protein Bca4012_061339 [Brassica carinata]